MSQREIKFRAWDKREKSMYPEFQETYMFADAITDNNVDWKDARYVVMQYTGLKDKNGKEVYEGDIVNHGDNYPSIVRFGVNSYGYELEEPGYEDEGYKSRWHEFGTAYTNPIEVIGNIWETPELLK